jgi:hypothetical protein
MKALIMSGWAASAWVAKRPSLKLAALAVVVGLSSLGYEATAGFRHLRVFRSNCAGPSCAMPSCSGPSFGCSAPRGCHSPMMLSCSSPSCSGPIYVTPPMFTSACSMPMSWQQPACSAPVCSGPSCFQPACSGPSWSGSSYSSPAMMNPGYGSSSDFGLVYEQAPVYGVSGHAIPHLGTQSFGNPSFGGARTLPAYYAPMSPEYAPIPPMPASEIVW